MRLLRIALLVGVLGSLSGCAVIVDYLLWPANGIIDLG